MYKNLEITKQNGDIAFNEEEHIYFNVRHADRKYTSVTKIISTMHEPFSELFWGHYKAVEKLMSPEVFKSCGLKSALLKSKTWNPKCIEPFHLKLEDVELEYQNIIAGYAKTRDEACDYGTAYHLKQENKFYTKDKHKIQEYNFGIESDKEFQIEKNNFDLNRENAILPEYLVYYSSPNGIMNIAGQIDVLLKENNSITLVDFKTNQKGIETKAYFNPITKKKKMMYAPLTHIEDTTLEHYTLQLSIYAYMLQQINPEFEIKLLRIIHVDREGNETLIDLQYRKNDVVKLFKHYEKQIVIDHYRKTGKVLTSNKDL